MRALALILCLTLGVPALAQSADPRPHPQLVASVQMRLSQRGYHVDVSKLSVAQVVALHFTLQSGELWWRENMRIDTILGLN